MRTICVRAYVIEGLVQKKRVWRWEQSWGKMFSEEEEGRMVLIERDGTRKPICRVCRKAKEGVEPTDQYSVFICGGCMERIREEAKEYNPPLGRPRKRRSV